MQVTIFTFNDDLAMDDVYIYWRREMSTAAEAFIIPVLSYSLHAVDSRTGTIHSERVEAHTTSMSEYIQTSSQ
jgi:hypothetical protein